MLTLMAMRWNQQKVNNLALTRRYQKVMTSVELILDVQYCMLAVYEAVHRTFGSCFLLLFVIVDHKISAKPVTKPRDHESPIDSDSEPIERLGE